MSRRDDDRVESFRALYEATARDLLAYLLRRTSTPEDAADCLAETFLIAWEKRGRMPSDREHARPWLFGVARNVQRRTHEHRARADAASTALARELQGIPRFPHDDDDPVTRALARLPALDREIIELLAWDRLPPREIAVILGLSPNVVRVRASRARQKLRASLAAVHAPDLR